VGFYLNEKQLAFDETQGALRGIYKN